MCIYTAVMDKHTKPTVQRVKRGKRPALRVLHAASDQNIWTALTVMKRRGDIKGKLPEYTAIQNQLADLGLPVYDNKQISKSILRLKSLRYIRESVELAA